MLKKQDIRVRKCYVNEDAGTVREVVAELNRHMVRYNSFDLASGNLLFTSDGVCHVGRLARWADRVARPEELARLHPYASHPRLGEPPVQREAEAEFEIARAEAEFVAGTQALHRW